MGDEKPIKIVATKKKSANRRIVTRFIIWLVVFAAVVITSLAAGTLAGYRSGSASRNATATRQLKSNVDEQYLLAVQDLAEGRFDVAFQRLEFVIAQDPAYPGATDKMAEVMAIIYATATPTTLPPTATTTPTPDLRPVEEMFAHAKSLVTELKWTEAIDTLAALRKADLAYQTARVDGLLFISLRMRGFDKIWKDGDLNGGIYDLALAERFGPLDSQSLSARDLARLYLIGSSFWEVDPAQAVQYFSQVAAAAPNLRDASGWTASARYREVLIQYGDKLASGNDWCGAQQQYELALAIGPDETLQQKAQEAALRCSPPTATPASTGETPSATAPTITLPPALTPSPTNEIPPTNTQPVEPPTNTSEPPTNTSEPPTNTSEPPTNTPEPPVATDTVAPPAQLSSVPNPE